MTVATSGWARWCSMECSWELGADHPAEAVPDDHAAGFGEQRRADDRLDRGPAAGQVEVGGDVAQEPPDDGFVDTGMVGHPLQDATQQGRGGHGQRRRRRHGGREAELSGHRVEHGDLAAVDRVREPGIDLLHGIQGGDVGDRGPGLDHFGPQHVAVEPELDGVDLPCAQGVPAGGRQALVQPGGPAPPQRVGLAALLAAAVHEHQVAHRPLPSPTWVALQACPVGLASSAAW